MAQDADLDQQPLKGVVLCLSADDIILKTKLADVAIQMGAVHKLDLTADVTHLLVGNINTPKYKYVAKERPDICVLSPDFVEGVREAWTAGGEVDVESLEKEYTLPPFIGLQLCLTGVEDATERKEMERVITENGGFYNGDLTRQVTHLIVAKPAGAKYLHAKLWGINVVSLKWYTDCLTRGLSLDENCYLPEMPLEQQGVGAFRTVAKRTSLGKRGRDDEHTAASSEPGRKKLRKSASQRMNAESQDFWQDFTPANDVQVDNTLVDAWNNASQTLEKSASRPSTSDAAINLPGKHRSLEKPQGLFGGVAILIHGFAEVRTAKLRHFLEPNGATVAASAQELRAAVENDPSLSSCLVVPHDTPVALPAMPEGTTMVTEWWVERCIHMKQHLNPLEDPLSSPLCNAMVAGFENLTISTTGFTGVDLRMTAEVVQMMGASYQETLLPSTSLLICATETVKKEKAFYANRHGIPVVTAEWLWQSLRTKEAASPDEYSVKLPLDPSDTPSQPSASSPALGSGRLPPFRRPGGDHELHPQRLSNTRKRATPSLPLTASRPVSSKSGKAPHCPFVMEDEEEEATVDTIEPPVTAQARDVGSLPVPSAAAKPLREISPNASAPKNKLASNQTGSDGNEAVTEAVLQDPADPMLPQHSPPRSPEKENGQPSPIAKSHLTSELAGLLNRHVDSDKPIHQAEEKKRKNRPLGRNLSVISHRSNSASTPAEEAEHISAADGFVSSREVPKLPPSTQLGYETPEAEAHRREMGKKMGCVLPEDVSTRTTIGTVKDSRDFAARSSKGSALGGRSKTRSRNT